MNDFNVRGIYLFGLEVLGLISSGRTETLDGILKEINNSSVFEYVCNKYESDFAVEFLKNDLYEVSRWEQAFHDFYAHVNSCEEAGKWNVCGEDDGLLLLVAFVLDVLANRSIDVK